jgi:hypothetical protein
MFEIAAVICFMLGVLIAISLAIAFFVQEHNDGWNTKGERLALKGIITIIILFTITFIIMGVSVIKGLF